MSTDEAQIRELVTTWMVATKAGDIATVLSLMTEDVVFLMPGRPAMRKADFAAQARAQTTATAPTFEGTSSIQEIQVCGDWAFIWTQLQVVVTSPGGTPVTRAGPTLTVLRKDGGKWRLARDANMLSVVSPDPSS
jgi:uncharacterized protein (TIGR02246 family)